MKCVICNKKILAGKYLMDSWNNKAHIQHNGHRTIACNSCGRLTIDSYNHLCDLCNSDIIESNHQINNCLLDVCKQLSRKGIIINEINIQTIGIVHSSYFNNKIQLGVTKTKTITNGCKRKVNHEIYILENLPKLQFKGVLAHELIHTWTTEKNCKLEDYQEEGFANLGSFLIYQNANSLEGRMRIARLEKDTSFTYGKGFAFMKEVVDKYGWERLIRRILATSLDEK